MPLVCDSLASKRGEKTCYLDPDLVMVRLQLLLAPLQRPDAE